MQGEQVHEPRVDGSCAFQHLAVEDIDKSSLLSRTRSVPKVHGSNHGRVISRLPLHVHCVGETRTNIPPVERGLYRGLFQPQR